jgi:hypothetical protein
MLDMGSVLRNAIVCHQVNQVEKGRSATSGRSNVKAGTAIDPRLAPF